MNRLTLVFLLSLLSAIKTQVVFAEQINHFNRLTPVAQTKDSSFFSQRPVSLTVGAIRSKLTHPGNGAFLRVAQDYAFLSFLSGTSAFTGSLVSYRYHFDSHYKAKYYDLGFSQGVNLDVPLGRALILRPFVEVGVAIGTLNRYYKNYNPDRNSSFEYNLNYTKLTQAVGIQGVLNSHYLLYVKYERGQIRTSKSAETTLKTGSTEVNGEMTNGDERRQKTKSVSVGIGYLYW